MRIGADLLLIAVGAILRFGISMVSTYGVAIHTIGDILILVGVFGVVLWLVVRAPWTGAATVVPRYDPAHGITDTGLPAASGRGDRALTAAGYTELRQLANVPAAELSKLHGVGPKALRLLQKRSRRTECPWAEVR